MWAFGRLGEMLGRECVDLDAPFVLGGVRIQKEVVGCGILGGCGGQGREGKEGCVTHPPSNGILVALGSVLLPLTHRRRRHVRDSRCHLILDRSSRHMWAIGRLGEMLGRERVDLDAPFILGGVRIQKEAVCGGIFGGCGGYSNGILVALGSVLLSLTLPHHRCRRVRDRRRIIHAPPPHHM